MESLDPRRPEDDAQPSSEPRDAAVRAPRALRLAVAGAVTLVLFPLNAQFLIHSETVHYAGFPTTISLFYHAVLVLFIIALLNVVLRRLAPKLVVGPAEMGLIYIALCIASTLSAHDAVQVLAPMMAHVHRYAGPENNWQSLIIEHQPAWLTVSDQDSLKILYEGDGSVHDPAVYRPWLGPSAWWIAFAFAFHMATFGLVSMFRRRWIESERLTFPIIQLPMELMHGRGRFLREPALWIALGIALSVDILNGLHTLYPLVPQIPTRGQAVPGFDLGAQIWDRPWNAIGFTPLAFYPIVIGLGLLLPTELAFSCWFFFWFWRAVKILVRAWGLEFIPQFPYIDFQSLGGYIGIALFALYLSRRHVADVLRAAFGGRTAIDQSREAMGYRFALWLFIGCTAFLIWFSVRAGMSLGYAVAYFAIYMAIAFSISRIRAEMGMPAHDLHFAGPSDVLPAVIGTRNLSVETRILSRMYFWFNRAYRNHQGPHQIEALKICEQTGLRPRVAAWTIALSTVLGGVFAFWATLWCYAYYGAAAKTRGSPLGFGWELYNHMTTELTNPLPANGGTAVATVLGCLAMLGGLALKIGVPWWPIHPAGFAVSASWTMQFMWCPLLISWSVKALVSRYGGGRAYRRLVPIAFGLILGDLIGGVFWSAYGIKLRQPIYSIFQ